jgi:CRP-like cAMP-binding protein
MTQKKGGGRRPSNRLLGSLQDTEYAQIEPYLELVSLRMRQILHAPGDFAEYVYFPYSGVLSSLLILESGDTVEVATVGNEGMADIDVVFGLRRARYRLMVQVPGDAARIPTDAFKALLQANPGLMAAMARYLTAMFTLVAQSAACNRLHPVQERCARWLLMTHDRVGTDLFPVTQEFLADMLGARRPTVTLATGMLREANLIQYERGRATILNRTGLEEVACECYRTVRDGFDSLFEHSTRVGLQAIDPAKDRTNGPTRRG